MQLVVILPSLQRVKCPDGQRMYQKNKTHTPAQGTVIRKRSGQISRKHEWFGYSEAG